MAAFKNVALWGTGGTNNVGASILSALIADGSFNLTIITRQSSKSAYAPTLNVIRVADDLNHESLVSALRGQDAIISAVGESGLSSQPPLARAAAAAGVRRFIPSEWGFDNGDPANAALSPPIFAPKHEFAKQLQLLSDATPAFSWTAVATGLWLDWALPLGFIGIDTAQHIATTWDDGRHAPSMVTLDYAAQAVVAVLKRADQFKDQRVYLQAFAASQRDIIAELEKQQGVKYVVSDSSGVQRLKEAHEALEKGFDMDAAVTTVLAELFTPVYKADFVNAGKQPILEHFADLPKVALQDVIAKFLASQQA